MRPALIFILITFFIAPIYAQSSRYSSNNKLALKYYATAGQNIQKRQYDEAIAGLNEAIKADPDFIEAHLQLGDLHRLQRNYQLSANHYLKAINLDADFNYAVYLKLGEDEVNLAQYAKAKKHLEKYLGLPKISGADYANKLIADCDFSIEAMKYPVAFIPQNMDEINSADDEYMPVATADESTLIFTRKINNNEDFYHSIKKDGKWQQPTYLSNNINTTSYNEGAQSISQDGKYLFFTGCNRPDGYGRCDIYIAQKHGDGWGKPVGLNPPVNTGAWESQPSISADGRTLYFVSNKGGGYGGYDIWKTTLLDNGWSEPENMGPNINSAYDEQSPFIHPDDSTLYFSSNGWPGLGNKDLFISRLNENGEWGKPQNLGYPINSSGDENGLTLTANGRYAFFSSNNLQGKGGFDIYTFEMPLNVRPRPVTYVKGTITDAGTGKPLEAEVEIIDLEKNRMVYQDYSSDDKGEFLATLTSGKNYGLNISKSGYLFYSENFSLKKLETKSPFNITVSLSPIEVGKKVVLKNIFFDVNKYDLKSESKAELSKIISFLNDNPDVRIEISGHTDNTGNNLLNQTLSANRAKSVYNYLVTNKVDAARLVYKGYGKTQPIADNATEDGRQLNRRTEFKIVAK